MKSPILVAIRRCTVRFAAYSAVATGSLAAAAPTIHSPLTPQESIEQMVVAGGLKVELAAHEPNVIDPVEIRFDEDGRMWVVEMRDYPTNSPDRDGRSRISILEDKNQDGFFETATVFADKLRFATGLQPWKGGAFVTLEGQLVYMKDSSGDGRADIIESWYTGFAQQNTQLRSNHPRLALDNHIYIANGLRGGTIIDAQRPHSTPVSINGMDFRFHPITRASEAVSGMGQFGLTFDDDGNRFVCTNRKPVIHIVLEDRDLKKNPLLGVEAVSQEVAPSGDASRVHPIAQSWTTSNLHAGQFTAACGILVYRGDALPDGFYGNVFVCEPTAHLVHREIMRPAGVTFASAPANVDAEFFASRDPWCLPVNLEIGPDGALYVVDMYRAVVEHPEFMPEELRQRVNFHDGADRGRIYRIVPSEFRRPAIQRLSSLASADLVALLGDRNAWLRETAARLLLERQDQSVGPQLERVATQDHSTLARIHALWLLDGLGVLTDECLLRLLDESEPRVVEQAIIAADLRGGGLSNRLNDRISALARHRDARVRFQALVTATPLPAPPAYAADPWELRAMLLAAGARGGEVLAAMQKNEPQLTLVAQPKRFIAELARLAAASRDNRQIELAIQALLASAPYRQAGLSSLLAESARQGRSLDDVRQALDEATRRNLDQVFEDARSVAADSRQPESLRGEAIDLVAFSSNSQMVLAGLALDCPLQSLRLRAIAALAKDTDLDPWRRLLQRFANQTPALQHAILDGLLAKADRTSLLLDEVSAGRIAIAAIDASRVQMLLHHRDGTIRRRAQSVLAGAVPADRQQALDKYKPSLKLPALPARGRAVFQKHCAICHRIGELGVALAPDISDSREKSPEQLLTDIVQPNRAIDANYMSYTVVTRDGQVQTGILTAEISASLTLLQPEGKTRVLQREDIEQLFSNGVSLMPDGIERLISLEEMADLIAFIKNWRYLPEFREP